jgi:transcriptional regulator
LRPLCTESKEIAVYIPPAFRDEDRASLHATMRAAPLANFVTATDKGLFASPLPLIIDADEGPQGVLYGHLARANPQWQSQPVGEALAIFMGPDAYITPAWYATKQETGKVVPTWNYITVHAYGVAEYFDDAHRLLAIVTRLTNLHEKPRAAPWAVTDAPADFIRAQLRGIVGIRMPLTRIEGKRKMSQNRPAGDQSRVVEGLAASANAKDHAVAALMAK